jgi:hypothetical protein
MTQPRLGPAAVGAALLVGLGLASSAGLAAASYLPGGPYAASCAQIYMDGGTLHAVCRRPDGTWRPTHILAPSCRGHGIVNQSGVLACGS